jgi:hypothetical protein
MQLRRWLCAGLTAVALAACGEDSTEERALRDEPSTGHTHEHGPHDGELVRLSGGAGWVEVVPDTEIGTMQVFVYGSDKKTPLPIEAAPVVTVITSDGSVPVALTASTEDGVTTWKGTSPALATEPWKGTIELRIGERSYSVSLADVHMH